MAEQQGTPLTRHPELQAIREAQNQLLLDPGFLQSIGSLLGGGGAAQAPAQSNVRTKDSPLTRMFNNGQPLQIPIRDRPPNYPFPQGLEGNWGKT